MLADPGEVVQVAKATLAAAGALTVTYTHAAERLDRRRPRSWSGLGVALMADTLRDLAGDAFHDVDVISALHAPLTPEHAVAATTTSSCRTPAPGIAAALDHAVRLGRGPRAPRSR